MKKILAAGLAVGMMLAGMASLANATVLDFEDPQTDTYYEIMNGYGGLNWTNMYVIDGAAMHPGTGYANGIVSGSQVAFNGWGALAVTSATGTDFDFNGAYLTGVWMDQVPVTVEGRDNGAVVYSSTVTASFFGPTYFGFDYRSIDELRFTTALGVDVGLGDGYQFAMDDFTFHCTPTPVPASLLLLGSGLAGLAGFRLNSRKS
ncbi:MAG: PEP-CTERM sorting domain-containing protein [Thermodesulfobacteriota bacterium]